VLLRLIYKSERETSHRTQTVLDVSKVFRLEVKAEKIKYTRVNPKVSGLSR